MTKSNSTQDTAVLLALIEAVFSTVTLSFEIVISPLVFAVAFLERLIIDIKDEQAAEAIKNLQTEIVNMTIECFYNPNTESPQIIVDTNDDFKDENKKFSNKITKFLIAWITKERKFLESIDATLKQDKSLLVEAGKIIGITLVQVLIVAEKAAQALVLPILALVQGILLGVEKGWHENKGFNKLPGVLQGFIEGLGCGVIKAMGLLGVNSAQALSNAIKIPIKFVKQLAKFINKLCGKDGNSVAKAPAASS